MGIMDSFVPPFGFGNLAIPDNLNINISRTAVFFLLPIALLLTWYITTVTIQYYRLRHIPGPFLNAITPLVLTYHSLKGDITEYTYEIARKYGPLARLQPNMVVYTDPDTFRRICSYKAGYTKGLWFEFSRWDLNSYSCIAMRDNPRRKDRKNKIAPAWASGGLAKMETRVDKTVHSFLDLIERNYISSKPKDKSTAARPYGRAMDFGVRSMMFTLDVATSVTFGKAWGFLESDSDVNEYLSTSEKMLPSFGVLGSLPWLVYVMHAWPINLLMPGPGDRVGFGCLMKFATDQVNKRIEAINSKSDPEKEASNKEDSVDELDIIRSYLNNEIPYADVVQETITLVVAGTETTAVAFKFALLSLLTTPSAYNKLQSEIDAYYSSHPSTSADDIVPYSAFKATSDQSPSTGTSSFPYLLAILRETLRLWPPSAGLFSKQVPDAGDTVHGLYLPPGTEIGQCMLGMGRHPSIFGADEEDVKSFRPERWSEAAEQDRIDGGNRFEKMASTAELVFSTGKYVCLGKHVALMELGKFFVEVLRRYDISIVDKITPIKVRDPIVWLAKDFNIRFTRREISTE
ncbi:Cytochrome P450 [Rhypophila decipiens]